MPRRAETAPLYENLLRASIPFIKMVARRQGVPADYVDDVVQETLLTVHRIRQTYDSTRSVCGLAENDRAAARDRLSCAATAALPGGKSMSRSPLKIIPIQGAIPKTQADQVDRKSFLGVAVATLPARQREAVEQLALNGRSLADAAVATGLTPGALKVNFHRAA